MIQGGRVSDGGAIFNKGCLGGHVGTGLLKNNNNKSFILEIETSQGVYGSEHTRLC